MKPKIRKLSLHRETLRSMSSVDLGRAAGAATFAVPSQYCPISYWGPQSCGLVTCAASRGPNPCGDPTYTQVRCTLIC